MVELELSRDETIRQAARADDIDRYLSALLAPRRLRKDLIALAAFAGAVMKIPYIAREPQIAEIRLHWWREALDAGIAGSPSGNPIADQFAEVLKCHNLDFERINVLLDALVAKSFATEIKSDAELENGIAETQGTLFDFAAQILDGVCVTAGVSLRADAAQSYGLAVTALRLPVDLACGRMPLPPSFAKHDGDWRAAITGLQAMASARLAAVRSAQSAERRAGKSALLPAALVEPYFGVLTRTAHDASRDIAQLSPLSRVWHLGKAHLLGRI